MLYLIHGNSREKILSRSRELVEKILRSDKDINYSKMSVEDFDQTKLEELIGGQSLFAGSYITLCDGLLDSSEISAFVCKRAEELVGSKNTFIFREGELNKKELDTFKKAGAKIENLTFEVKRGYAGAREVELRPGYEDFNIFKFTDALGAKDKKMAWVLFIKGLRAGFPAEEFFWKAVWLFRNMITVELAGDDFKRWGERLKLSPFVVGNSRKFLKNFTREGLLNKYGDLVDMYHQFRRGEGEAEILVERFILNL